MAIEPFAVSRQSAAQSQPPAPTPRRSRRAFTREEILDAIRRWTDEYGEPPAYADWDPARARRLGQTWRIARFENGRWPTVRQVQLQFRTFGAAVVASGVKPARIHEGAKPHIGDDAEILKAIREWTMRYGEVPSHADWDPARAKALGQEWREVRYRLGDWPSLSTVIARFGSLRLAVEAAGLAPTPRNEAFSEHQQRSRENERRIVSHLARDQNLNGEALFRCSLKHVAEAKAQHDSEQLAHALRLISAAALRWSADLRQGC